MDDQAEEVEVVSPIPKKPRQAKINWNDAKLIAILEQCYINKPYGTKKVAAAYETVSATLNAHCEEFKAVPVSGANVKTRMEEAVASYVGTHLSDASNKSGFDGDKDDESNYSDLMLCATKIHEEMENIAKR